MEPLMKVAWAVVVDELPQDPVHIRQQDQNVCLSSGLWLTSPQGLQLRQWFQSGG